MNYTQFKKLLKSYKAFHKKIGMLEDIGVDVFRESKYNAILDAIDTIYMLIEAKYGKLGVELLDYYAFGGEVTLIPLPEGKITKRQIYTWLIMQPSQAWTNHGHTNNLSPTSSTTDTREF